MTNFPIEQAIYGSRGPGGYHFLARSPGFLEEWLPEAERLCTGFGERPPGVHCPFCVFARPFGPQHVAVVQVADQGIDDAGRPGALGFRLLILGRKEYEAIGGDPFAIADRFPPSWQSRDFLPTLTWTDGPLPARTVSQVQQVLQRAGDRVLVGTKVLEDSPDVYQGGSHVLLGGAQVLVDGGRVVFEREEPDTDLLRALWTLLPTRTRSRLWPASFAFGNALHFDAVVVPRIEGEEFASYRTEAEAADYPEGNYEYAVQHAAETGDQQKLDALFARRSSADMLRFAVILIIVLGLLTAIINLLPNGGPVAPPDQPPGKQATLDLPPANEYPTLSADERQRLTDALRKLGKRLDVPTEGDAETMLQAIDTKLGTPDPTRDPGPLGKQGPVQRQLRVLLWKRGVKSYNEPGLNTVELLDRLEEKVAPQPK